MPAQKLGPGRLTIGETGTPTEWGAYTTNTRLEPEVDDGDTMWFLDNTSDNDETESYVLAGTIAQTYDAESLLLFCHENRGKKLPFTFVPSDDSDLIASGTIRIRAVSIGGDVKVKNTSDFEFPGVDGFYELASTGVPAG